MEVSVSFIEMINNQESFVLTTGFPIYPSYRPMDTIWVEIVNRDNPEKTMKMTRFIIDKIHHSVREVTNSNRRTAEHPAGIYVSAGLEVYVVKMNE